MIKSREGYYSDYEYYAAYRELIINGQRCTSESTDKFVLTLASASIGLIITLLSKLIFDSKAPQIITFYYIEYGMYCLVVSLILVIASMMLSSFIYQTNGKLCDEIMNNRTDIINLLDDDVTDLPEVVEFKEIPFLRTITQWTHYFSPVFLIIGILCIGLFFINNTETLKHDPQTAAETYTQLSNHSSATAPSTTNGSSSTTSTTSKKTTTKELEMSDVKIKTMPPPPPPPKSPANKEK
ncbi:hypothetical protein [Psychromonas sp. SR45-3]|uniref:hypothetical protein n=1 Tax=Psychromonas sp. SR45-3 TaxID=2760930 RepID=UPI0015FB5EBD|nr:hypothetical protein [Psychromonas sp. SR45-3]MBB1274548.1 hypothetical protein [Psychromonas sp. SR45-3]